MHFQSLRAHAMLAAVFLVLTCSCSSKDAIVQAVQPVDAASAAADAAVDATSTAVAEDALPDAVLPADAAADAVDAVTDAAPVEDYLSDLTTDLAAPDDAATDTPEDAAQDSVLAEDAAQDLTVAEDGAQDLAAAADSAPDAAEDLATEDTDMPGDAVTPDDAAQDQVPAGEDAAGSEAGGADAEVAADVCAATGPELCDGLDNDCDGQTDEAGCEDGNACTLDACAALAGGGFACEHKGLSGAPCSDGNPCSEGDACAGSVCSAGSAKVCNDDKICTDDGCDAASGACVFTPNSAACDDGSLCTAGDACLGGACTGSAADCDDKNPCTIDGCNAQIGCFHTYTTAACDDGNACTKGDVCALGICAGTAYTCGGAPDSCHQAGSCNGDGTCSFANKPDGTGCDDGSACTSSDVCTGGICAGTAYTCAAPDGCHEAGVCSGDGTCAFAKKPDGTVCNDGAACTQGDVCSGGVCAGTAYTCDAPDQCQNSVTCDGAGGCLIASKPNGTACDDGNACTTGEACKSGVCSGGAAHVCPAPTSCQESVSCDGIGGCAIVNKEAGAACEDGSVCTVGDTCQSGVCSPGAPLACLDDGNVCTAESCDAKLGCVHLAANDGAVCSAATCNGSAKVAASQCAGGVCPAALKTSCDDGNACTADSCDKGACVHDWAPPPEICNGIDDNCDGQTDEAGAGGCTVYFVDGDHDGFGSDGSACLCAPSGLYTASQSGDCNDGDSSIKPTALEICNGKDDNCDGATDIGAVDALTFFRDLDGDGFGTSSSVVQCFASAGFTALVAGDCDDQNALRNPGAPEICNGIDDNCDFTVDNMLTETWVNQPCCPTGNLADCQNTGGGSRCATGTFGCSSGVKVCTGGVIKLTETCNNVDDDCNGATDDIALLGAACSGGGTNTTGNCTAKYTCSGLPGPGPSGLICTQVTGPKAEVCNGQDDNCDGVTDNNPTDVGASYPCADNCPGGLIANCIGECHAGNLTCSDGVRVCSGSTGPTTDVCNGKDDNCNGTIDDGFGYPNYNSNVNSCGSCGNVCGLAHATNGCHTDLSIDATGRGVCYVASCLPGFNYLPGSAPESGPTGVGCFYACPKWPTTAEICNGIDDNCDGNTDEGVQIAYYRDLDGDGYGNANVLALACTQPAGYASNSTDCSDSNAAVHPGATEVCNGIDDNCNGSIDEGNPGGGFVCSTGKSGVCAAGTTLCSSGVIVCSQNVQASAEVCDNLDNNCNGATDDNGAGGALSCDDANPCTISDTCVAGVCGGTLSTPAPVITAGSNGYVTAGRVNLPASVATNGAVTTVQWSATSSPAGAAISGSASAASTLFHPQGTPGTMTLSCTVSNAAGCFANANKVLTVVAPLAPVITAGSSGYVNHGQTNLPASVTSTGVIGSVWWSLTSTPAGAAFSGATNTTSTTFSTQASAGSLTLTVTLTNQAGDAYGTSLVLTVL